MRCLFAIAALCALAAAQQDCQVRSLPACVCVLWLAPWRAPPVWLLFASVAPSAALSADHACWCAWGAFPCDARLFRSADSTLDHLVLLHWQIVYAQVPSDTVCTDPNGFPVTQITRTCAGGCPFTGQKCEVNTAIGLYTCTNSAGIQWTAPFITECHCKGSQPPPPPPPPPPAECAVSPKKRKKRKKRKRKEMTHLINLF
jgi:hypothetical protein